MYVEKEEKVESNNVVYFSQTSEFFLRMVNTIEKAARELGIEVYRERRFREGVVFYIGASGKPYKISFTVRERENGQHIDIIGTYTIGVFPTDDVYVFGVHKKEGSFGSSLKITSKQHLAWEIFAEITNAREVEEYFFIILRTFTGKAEKIHNMWSSYVFAKERFALLQKRKKE